MRVSLTPSSKVHFWLTTRGLDLRPWQGSKRVCTRASNRTCNPEPDPSSHRKFVRVPVSPTRGSSRQIRSLGAFWNTYRTAVSRPRRFFRKTSPVEKRSTGKAISRILKTGLRRTPWRDCFFQHCQPVLMLCPGALCIRSSGVTVVSILPNRAHALPGPSCIRSSGCNGVVRSEEETKLRLALVSQVRLPACLCSNERPLRSLRARTAPHNKAHEGAVCWKGRLDCVASLFPVGASRVEARVGKVENESARVEKKQHQLDTDRTLATKTRDGLSLRSGVITPFGVARQSSAARATLLATRSLSR